MKAAALSNWKKKRNRIISKVQTWKDQMTLFLEVKFITFAAGILNMGSSKQRRHIEKELLPLEKEDPGIIINCMGHVDETSHIGEYEGDLKSISGLLKKADLSIASYYSADKQKEMEKLFHKYGIQGIPIKNQYISAKLYQSQVGNVGVIFYRRSDFISRKKHIKVELTRRILTLKGMGAEFIIVYVENQRKKVITKREARLYRMLGRLGADYIVGVTPNLRNSGATYLVHEHIARSIYSLGTFLTEDSRLSNKRVVVRLKLRKIKGRLQLFEETYFPYYKTKRNHFVSLILGNKEAISDEKRRKYLSEIEREMKRLRSANRVLTVKRLMDVVGTLLPEKYEYLADFSVGKICARSFEVEPGDVFFFRQPFEDANDLEPVNPRKRLRIVKNAAKRGTLLILSFQELSLARPWIQVPDAMEAHIAVCAYLRRLLPVKAVGITGSVGKTSTKDMLAEVMKTKYTTVKSERNGNVQVKIGLGIQKLNSDCEVYIQEIGGGRPGGASRHSRMILPKATVVTNIGNAHIGNFGSQKKLMENKIGIIEGMPQEGVLYLNGDDPLLRTAKLACSTIFYAVDNKKADYYAEGIKEGVQSTEFFVVHKKERTKVKLKVLGKYNILNAVCCFAIGEHFGIPKQDIVKGLANFRTSGIRQNLVQVAGRKIFMDCYNASSESIKLSMEVLLKIKIKEGRKRIAVLGDITGMGELAEDVHRSMAQTLMQYPVDQYIFYGNNVQKTHEIMQSKGFISKFISKREQLNQTLREIADVGDVILFKGSSKMLLEQSVDMVFGTRFTDQRFLDEREFKRVNRGGITYNLFENYATVSKYDSSNITPKIKKNLWGIEVVNIGRAFYSTKVQSVTLPDSIRHIGAEAFMNCSHLKEFHFPLNLKFIGERAFENCTSMESALLPDGLLHIGTKAFYGCKGLQKLFLPETVVQIGAKAFEDCEKAMIYCKKGSYAAEYMEREGISYHIY